VQQESPRGSRSYLLPKGALGELFSALRARGYRVIGPRVGEGAIVYGEVDNAEQDGGLYRLRQDGTAGYFDHVVGPHSLKPYLFPPRETLLSMERRADGWRIEAAAAPAERLAVVGVRSCDLHALAIQDRVFLEGPYQDPGYRARRENLFLVAVQCRRAAATCFCHSMDTGPRAERGFDLALAEGEESFVVEVGSEAGAGVADAMSGLRPAEPAEVAGAVEQSRELRAHLEMRRADSDRSEVGASPAPGPRPRSLDTEGLRELLLGQPDHPRWTEVAERCLSCANCTMVCPTCFCSSVQEVTDLTGDQVARERTWDSCFTADHSRVSSGVVRASTSSRYRQWLTHKLASWIDQFGTSGCVGCGRCITWCPVGIDLTEEVAAIRGGSS
jgi:sulfhydrogenase subunit beta (sulfur reductase)